MHNTKVCRMAVRRKTFPTNRSKLSPRSADDIKLGTLLGSTLLHARYGCISVHSPSCVSYLCLILFFSDVPERTSVCFRSLSFCVSYLFVFFIPCRYFCESFGLFSIPLFLFVSYLFVLLFLADVPARVLACFLSLAFFVFLNF